MNIIGLAAYYHDSACCLLQDGRLVAAAAEERFTRRKHDRRLPVRALRFCLERGGIGVENVDCVAFYESPVKKQERQIATRMTVSDPGRPERELRDFLGYEGPFICVDHHASHAASAYFYSGFRDAAILTVDGVGEWATTTYGVGQGSAIQCFEEVRFPHSLGLLYSTITSLLGFEVNDGEYKVMGLAPYGSPRYLSEMSRLARSGPGGRYRLILKYFDFRRGDRMYTHRLCDLFRTRPRAPDSPITQKHKDIARSLQLFLEELLLEKVRWLGGRADSKNLCMAGGVALNCVAAGRLVREGPFRTLFVPPAAGDDGGAIGAAALAHVQLAGARHTMARLTHAYLGPSFASGEIRDFLDSVGITPVNYQGRVRNLLEDTAERLARGEVVGWFHGAMEFGPRALGARSILADPRLPDMRDRINRLVKKREAFRPFAPSVLTEERARYFELDHPSPFMLETCLVRPGHDLPAITHVDRSARPQTVDRRVSPRFAALIDAFRRRTGCPMVLNTSFNLRGEPIVCSYADAVRTMIKANLDALVLEEFLIPRERISDDLSEAVELWYPEAVASDISSSVYTFI